MSPRRWLRTYVAHEDPLAEIANTLALVIAFNAPLYPPTVLWRAGSAGQPWVWLSASSFPFFFAIPALMRRSSRLGRSAFLVVGVANTAFCTWLLGEASGTALFLLPCVALAPLLFRREEMVLALLCAGLPFVAYFALAGHWGAPPHTYTPLQYDKLRGANAFSVACLLGFIGLQFGWLRPGARSGDAAGPD